jgi:hypothetical protein
MRACPEPFGPELTAEGRSRKDGFAAKATPTTKSNVYVKI